MNIVLIATAAVLVLIFAGMSIPVCFLLGSVLYCVLSGSSFNFFMGQAFYSLDSNSLLAIPLFTLAGVLIDKCGIARVLVDAGERLLKGVKGGMGATIPVVSCFFGALSGSGVATATVMSTMLAPRLKAKGWDIRYVAAFIAASGPLGFLIPPNVNAIVFSKVSSASVSSLFLATVFPAIIMCALYLLINRLTYEKWYSPVGKEEAGEEPSEAGTSESLPALQQKFSRTKEILPAVLFPVIVLGGIYGGIFTATEAGAVGCVYAVLVGCIVYRMLNFGKLKDSLTETAHSVGTLLAVLPMTMIFTRILVTNDVPTAIAAFITGVSANKYVIILVIDAILVIAGFFLNPTVMTLVMGPLLIPTATAVGISQIQLGVILFVSIGIGACTPPMSMLLFTAARLCDTTVPKMVKPLLPFLVFGALPVLLLTSFVPGLSEWLPMIFMK